jgi:hypothetical protein
MRVRLCVETPGVVNVGVLNVSQIHACLENIPFLHHCEIIHELPCPDRPEVADRIRQVVHEQGCFSLTGAVHVKYAVFRPSPPVKLFGGASSLGQTDFARYCNTLAGAPMNSSNRHTIGHTRYGRIGTARRGGKKTSKYLLRRLGLAARLRKWQ